MFGIVIVYGVISGAVIIATIMAGLTLGKDTPIFHSEFFGYLVQFIALTSIFFGVKRYRDRELGGVIKFLPALMMGISIALVAAAIYVGVWEFYLASTNYAFMEEFVAGYIAQKQAAGATVAEIDALKVQMEQMKELYKNPFTRVGITFVEIFPMGLAISFVSAAILQFPKVLPYRA